MPTEFEVSIEHMSNAGNRFIMNFCTEFCQKNKLSVLSFIAISVEKCLQKEIVQIATPFKTRYFFAHEKRLKGIVQYIKAVRQELRDADCVITYNAVYAWLCAPYLTKLEGKKSWLILADYSPAESYKSVFRKIYAYFQLKAIRKYDCVIGLSENAENYLEQGQKFLCMEGGISRNFYDYFDRNHLSDDGIVRFMYAGLLEPVTGIEQLILAFNQVNDPKARLMISGKGSLKEAVEKATKEDDRIVYLGCMPYCDYMEKLESADVLVNPRDMSLLENQYNFPSKILEYLGTGKEIISTKFPGWKKFSGHILFCESNVEAICKGMEKICIDRHENGFMGYQRNREFAEQFLWDKQIDRVLNNF